MIYYLAHKTKGLFIGWVFGPGIPVWSSDIPLLMEKAKPGSLDEWLEAPVPGGLVPEVFTSKDGGWQAGHLFEREPDEVFVFSAPDILAAVPKREGISRILEHAP